MRRSSRGNPYHDSLGRFCSGPCSSTVCVEGKYYDVERMSMDEKRKFVKGMNDNSFYDKQTENRNNGLKRARNTEKPIQPPSRKMSYDEARTALSDRGVMFGSLGKANKELMATNMQKLSELSDRYPLSEKNGCTFKFCIRKEQKDLVENEFYQRTGRIGKVRGLGGSRAIAYAASNELLSMSGEKGRVILITEAKYKNRDKFIAMEKESQDANWHVKGNLETHSLSHEYGHLVMYELEEKHGISCKHVRDTICEGMIPRERTELASEYGITGGSKEWCAEIFANAVNGEPNELGRRMSKFLKQYF